jgi:hypothetical protein
MRHAVSREVQGSGVNLKFALQAAKWRTEGYLVSVALKFGTVEKRDALGGPDAPAADQPAPGVLMHDFS